MTERRLNNLYERTREDINLALSESSNTRPERRIRMVESSLARYYKKRSLITGRRSGEKNRARLARYYRLCKVNAELRRQLKQKRWYKFW